MQNPSDREAAVRNLAEAVGGSLETYYLMMGQHDGCAILDAPDSMSLLRLPSPQPDPEHSPTWKPMMFTAAQFIEILEKAKSITTFQPPGS